MEVFSFAKRDSMKGLLILKFFKKLTFFARKHEFIRFASVFLQSRADFSKNRGHWELVSDLVTMNSKILVVLAIGWMVGVLNGQTIPSANDQCRIIYGVDSASYCQVNKDFFTDTWDVVIWSKMFILNFSRHTTRPYVRSSFAAWHRQTHSAIRSLLLPQLTVRHVVTIK